jgi:hypothetical protein
VTREEWALFAAEVEATFRGGLGDDREAALREHLGRVPFELARGAVARLVLDGQVFVPTAAELVGALRHVCGGQEGNVRAALRGLTPEEYAARLTDEWTAARRLRSAEDAPRLEAGT